MLEFLIGLFVGSSMSMQGNKRCKNTDYKGYFMFMCFMGLCLTTILSLGYIKEFALSSKDNANYYTIALIIATIIISIYNIKNTTTKIPMMLNLIISVGSSFLFLVNLFFLYDVWKKFYVESYLFLIALGLLGIMTFIAFIIMRKQFIRVVGQH